MTEENGAYGWDQKEIENPNEDSYVTLPEGVYNFTVKKMVRMEHDGSAKIPPCKKAQIFIEVDGGDLGPVTIKNNLFLHRCMDGINCQFFKCVGLRKHGDALLLDWGRVPGSTGRCKIAPRTYDGKTYNDIKSFLEPEEGSPPPSDDIPF